MHCVCTCVRAKSTLLNVKAGGSQSPVFFKALMLLYHVLRPTRSQIITFPCFVVLFSQRYLEASKR